MGKTLTLPRKSPKVQVETKVDTLAVEEPQFFIYIMPIFGYHTDATDGIIRIIRINP